MWATKLRSDSAHIQVPKSSSKKSQNLPSFLARKKSEFCSVESISRQFFETTGKKIEFAVRLRLESGKVFQKPTNLVHQVRPSTTKSPLTRLSELNWAQSSPSFPKQSKRFEQTVWPIKVGITKITSGVVLAIRFVG